MKHRIHSAIDSAIDNAIDATRHTHQIRWVWWVDCGRCGATEWWESWEVAVWYLELHMRVNHES